MLRDVERIGWLYENVPEFEGGEEESSEDKKMVFGCEGSCQVAGKDETQDEGCFRDTVCVCERERERERVCDICLTRIQGHSLPYLLPAIFLFPMGGASQIAFLLYVMGMRLRRA